jgi:PAS domain S-box-containing protein
MLGYGREELSGIHARELHPGDFQPDETLLAELKRGTRDSFKQESRYRRKDGSYLWGQLTVSVVHDAGGEPLFLIAMLEDATESRRAAEKSRAAEKMDLIPRRKAWLLGPLTHRLWTIGVSKALAPRFPGVLCAFWSRPTRSVGCGHTLANSSQV